MSDIDVFGAGAFGTALAISLARDGRDVTLIARNMETASKISGAGENNERLPGFSLPESLRVTSSPTNAPICLLAVPMQVLGRFVRENAPYLDQNAAVACCKGVDVASGRGATAIIRDNCDASTSAILSGPGFAKDIAAGLPTAMTIASDNESVCETLQSALSTSNLRLYRTTDVTGVELGGALKNVIAIAAGVAIGAGLGESARAAIMTRGYAEMKKFAHAQGAVCETLSGLSGFGDLVLTSTSTKSRNYSFGISLGAGKPPIDGITVEGIGTARAVTAAALVAQIEMPITTLVAKLVTNELTVKQAIEMLLARPLTKE